MRSPSVLQAAMASSHKKWVPLESNPDVLNEYAVKLGADLSQFQFCDVFGLDEASQLGGNLGQHLVGRAAAMLATHLQASSLTVQLGLTCHQHMMRSCRSCWPWCPSRWRLCCCCSR